MLKKGTRIKDRWLLDTDTLVRFVALDADREWRVFSLKRYARDEPEMPATEMLTADEQEVSDIVGRSEWRLPHAERGRPYPPDIRSWVVLLAHIAGRQSSTRRSLPGNEVLWRASVQLQAVVRVTQARAP